MSRTRHARPTGPRDAVLFVRADRDLLDALKARLAEERRRRPWESISMAGLVRRLIAQGIKRQPSEGEQQ